MAVSRAVSSALGVLLMTALTLVLAAVAGVAFIAAVPPGTGSPVDVPEPIVLAASADADTGWIVLVHESGPGIDVREIEVRIAIDGARLEHQPPVPFFGAKGFWGAPVGPFNDATDPIWERDELTGIRLASSNDPDLSRGATVRIEIYRDDRPIATVETTAG